MATDNSFDVVSKVEIQEVKNAIDQASKEVNARFDLKSSKSAIALEGNETIQLASQDEYTLKAVTEILSQKLVKRGVSLKNLEQGPGQHPGRHGSRHQQRPRYAAADHRSVARKRLRSRSPVHQLPLQLTCI
jgi:uncharacterized protein YajQ (UPF0234 family)